MVFRDSFSNDEWKTMQFAHFWVFQAVAGSDNKIDAEERIALDDIMKSGDKFENPLAREIMTGLEFNIDTINAEFAADERKIEDGLMQVADLLDAKIDKEVTINFKKTLLAVGVYVGHASGKWFSSNFSKEEVAALHEAGLYLRVSEDDLQKPPLLNEIVESFG